MASRRPRDDDFDDDRPRRRRKTDDQLSGTQVVRDVAMILGIPLVMIIGAVVALVYALDGLSTNPAGGTSSGGLPEAGAALPAGNGPTVAGVAPRPPSFGPGSDAPAKAAVPAPVPPPAAEGENPAAGTDVSLGPVGTRWQREPLPDGMPYAFDVVPEGKVGVYVQKGPGSFTGYPARLVALEAVRVGQWFRVEIRRTDPDQVILYRLRFDSDDQFTLAGPRGETPVVLVKSDGSRRTGPRIFVGGAKPAPKDGPATPPAPAVKGDAEFGPPGSNPGELAGVWARPAAEDGFPYRLEIRPDGSAKMSFHRATYVRDAKPLKDVTLDHAASLKLFGPVRRGQTGMMSFLVSTFRRNDGSYSYQYRLEGADKLVLISGPVGKQKEQAFERSAAATP